MTSALEGGGWSASHPGRFTPGKDLVRIVQEAGWAPGPVCTCAKNLAPPGFDPRTVQSLFWLSYLGPLVGPDGNGYSLTAACSLLFVCRSWNIWQQQFVPIVSLCDQKSRSRGTFMSLWSSMDILTHMVCHLCAVLWRSVRWCVYWVKCTRAPLTLLGWTTNECQFYMPNMRVINTK
jgi:hypothetical protein